MEIITGNYEWKLLQEIISQYIMPRKNVGIIEILAYPKKVQLQTNSMIYDYVILKFD